MVSRRVAVWLVMLSFGVAISILAPPAQADDSEAQTRMAARELAVSGAEAFDKQDYATALDRFQRAEALYKVPSIAIMVARCWARLGRFVESVDKYEETSRMPLDASAPEAFLRAVADAKAEVDGVSARVARLELRLPADAPPDVSVTLDDRQVPKALWGVPTPVNPGVHQVMARAPGREPYSTDLNLQEGARQTVDIVLRPQRLADPIASTDARPKRIENAPQRARSMLPMALFIGGGVSVAFGTVTGVVALGKKSTLDEQCDPGCPAGLSADLDTFRLTRTLSYVGFGVGLVAAGAGTYFLLYQNPTGTRVGALLLPGGAGLAGNF